jgi:hypothetical protein
MFKKIIVSALLVGLIAILAVGAINRTQAKASNETGFRQEVEGRVAQGGGQGRGASNGSQSLDYPDAEAQGGDQGWGASNRTQSQDGLNAETFGEGQAKVSELVELTGQVTSVDSALLLVSAASGETVEIANRAWSFAQEQGFTPQVGDSLTLTGFYEANGRLEVSQIENLTSGETLALRDENGRPMWAGRGRRGS